MKRFPWIAAIILLVIVMIAVTAPWLPLPSPTRMQVIRKFAAPSELNWLGNDELGRDVLSRLIWGARNSLTICFIASLLAAITGTALGIIGGFMRGFVEMITLRSMDILLCFPPLLLALLAVTLMGPGAATLVPILTLVFIPSFTRIAYAGVLTVRAQEYVEAQRALGATPARIMLRTILPNIAGPLLVQLSLVMATAIVLESGLSFLGLGVVPPTPSWGLMIGSARATMSQAPMLLVWPCIALTITILAMNMLCDGLRDVFDPHPDPQPAWQRAFGLSATQKTLPREHAYLEVNGLTLAIGADANAIRPVRDMSLSIRRGETVAIVGESGSGKTLTSLAAMGLLPAVIRPVSGSIRLDGREILMMDEEGLADIRGRVAAMIFQDPMSSLNPVHRIGDQITEAVLAHQKMPRAEAMGKAIELLASVGIPDPVHRARIYPHQMSGGMRQRVMIAIAVANSPSLLFADEPTTALDVTIQAQVLELLDSLKQRLGLAMVFISHSLPVVAEIADRVVVMYAGEVVEEGPAQEVFVDPRHPYTKALLASAPTAEGTPPEPISGVVPNPADLPKGCLFASRCPMFKSECGLVHPELVEIGIGRRSRCIKWSEL